MDTKLQVCLSPWAVYSNNQMVLLCKECVLLCDDTVKKDLEVSLSLHIQTEN